MRLIDADKLKSEFDYKHIDMNKTAAVVHHKNILEIINQQPTADVVPMDYHERCLSVEIQKRMNMVEVVRCKDCKHWHDNTEFCDFWSALNVAQRTIKTDYCSYGERAKGGEL